MPNSDCLSRICLFQVALDAIEELCYEMELHRPEALDEYAVFLVTHRGNVALKCQPQHILYKMRQKRVCVYLCRSECASTEQARVHPGYRNRGRDGGHQL